MTDVFNQSTLIAIPVDHNYISYIDKLSLIDINLVNSYHKPNDRAINFISQLLQKYYLAYVLSVMPNKLLIGTNQYNKPYLISHPELKFNISHSHDYVVLAYTLDKNIQNIGVDIEYIDSTLDIDEIKHIVYSTNEIELINTSHKPHDSFFKLWTKKESLIKAIGSGFGTDDYQATQLDLTDYTNYNNYHITTQIIEHKYYLSLCIIF